jgi:hypothetical protein
MQKKKHTGKKNNSTDVSYATKLGDDEIQGVLLFSQPGKIILPFFHIFDTCMLGTNFYHVFYRNFIPISH